MAATRSRTVPNRVFVGLPWKRIRPRYEKCIKQLERKFPIHFDIIGRNDTQTAAELLAEIKSRIDRASFGIFDATNGNANVSLEFGYAEGKGKPAAIYASDHKTTNKGSASTIISDLAGQIRVVYRNEKTLMARLKKFCSEHEYSKKFSRAFAKNRKIDDISSARKAALAVIRELDGKDKMSRADIIQNLADHGIRRKTAQTALNILRNRGLITVSRGRHAMVFVP